MVIYSGIAGCFPRLVNGDVLGEGLDKLNLAWHDNSSKMEQSKSLLRDLCHDEELHVVCVWSQKEQVLCHGTQYMFQHSESKFNCLNLIAI